MERKDKSPVITVEHLTARFGSNTIFENVGFEVYKGEIFVILGGSGCGKSTLMKHMIGLYETESGKVVINGVDITKADEKELREVRLDIGVAFQSGSLFGSMTVGENVALPLEEYTDLSPELIDLIVKMKLGMVELAGYENHLPEELSGGMKKRAGLARAMAMDPTVLFFDEPSAGLDPITSAELDSLIKSINAGMGTTMVIVTHELPSILNIADRIIMLDKEAKGIIAEGDPKWLKEQATDPRVRNFFNRRVPEQEEKGL
ncbi:MAG TPA: ATP-binding cassette domain-containing protein [Thermodesulfobacteriota bacterium]|nr:ATP-binding cassette domain-containing protein [Thermodesulfobacteriota bacterium]